MQPQKKKSHTVVLLIGWLIILYKTETAVCLPTLLFGTGTRGQSER